MIIVIAKKEKSDLQENIELLSEIKSDLKRNQIALEICNEYGFGQDIIDGISIVFSDNLDVSARTRDSNIELNSDLVNKDYNTIMRYVIHELVHALQHMERHGHGDPYEDKEYLDRPDELEAFQYQIKFENEVNGEDEAEEYVDHLVEYHDIDKDEKDEKKEELLDKI